MSLNRTVRGKRRPCGDTSIELGSVHSAMRQLHYKYIYMRVDSLLILAAPLSAAFAPWSQLNHRCHIHTIGLAAAVVVVVVVRALDSTLFCILLLLLIGFQPH